MITKNFQKRRDFLKKLVATVSCAVLATVVIIPAALTETGAQEQYTKGLLIKFKSNIISIPKDIDRFPIANAKIRSTALRDLNLLYNATVIERIYEIKQVGNKPPEKVEVKDTYIIWFGDEFIEMDEVLNAYSGLSAVNSVEQR